MKNHALKNQLFVCECGFTTSYLKIFIHHFECPDKPIGNIELKDFIK
jgi:hypothetical protein